MVSARASRADTVAQLTVGDGLEVGEHLQYGASGLRVFDELHGTLAQSRAVGVTLEHGLNDLRQAQSGLLEGLGDRRARLGGGELWVVGG